MELIFRGVKFKYEDGNLYRQLKNKWKEYRNILNVYGYKQSNMY